MADVIGILINEQIKVREIPRLRKEIIDGFRALPDRAGVVARGMDRLGLDNTVPCLRLPLLTPGGAVVGQAITVRDIPQSHTPLKAKGEGTMTRLGERESYFVSSPGDVIVIEGSTVVPASCLGPMSTRLAAKLGIAAVVVDGCVTGLPGIRMAGIPVWARGATTVTGHQRVETIEINGSIGIMGARVDPGDLIIGDDSGVTVVPFAYAELVLEEARKLVGWGGRIKELVETEGTPDEFKAALLKQMQDMANKKG